MRKGGRRRQSRKEVFVSIASCWALVVKRGLGTLRLTQRLDRFIPEQLTLNGCSLLAVELRHVAGVADLPFHHPDLFDRLLVAQALQAPTRTPPSRTRIWSS